jgi:hypothetical protein
MRNLRHWAFDLATGVIVTDSDGQEEPRETGTVRPFTTARRLTVKNPADGTTWVAEAGAKLIWIVGPDGPRELIDTVMRWDGTVIVSLPSHRTTRQVGPLSWGSGSASRRRYGSLPILKVGLKQKTSPEPGTAGRSQLV